MRGGHLLGLLPLGLLAAGGELDLPLGGCLGAQRLALLQEPLDLAAQLIGLSPGLGDELVVLPPAGDLELGDLPLGGGPQGGGFPVGGGALPGGFLVGGGAPLGGLPLRGRDQVIGPLRRGAAGDLRGPVG